MKLRKLMEMLNQMHPENDIFVQEINREGTFLVDTKYTIIEVHQILNWTYINIVKDEEDDETH